MITRPLSHCTRPRNGRSCWLDSSIHQSRHCNRHQSNTASLTTLGTEVVRTHPVAHTHLHFYLRTRRSSRVIILQNDSREKLQLLRREEKKTRIFLGYTFCVPMRRALLAAGLAGFGIGWVTVPRLWRALLMMCEVMFSVWIRSLPLADEVSAREGLAFVNALEMPVVLTRATNLMAMEEARRLEISGSDRSHMILAKTLELCGMGCTFGVVNACDNVDCRAASITTNAVESSFAYLLTLESVNWSKKATITGRFLQAGRLRTVHAPLTNSERYFAASVERRRGDIISLKRRTDRRGIVLYVDWIERMPQPLAAFDFGGVVFVVAGTDKPRHEAVYTVLAEDGRLEEWYDSGVFGAVRPPLLLEGNVDLLANPTKATRPNTDRNHYELGSGWARHLLRFVCRRRDECFFVRAPHKSVKTQTLCTLALYSSATLWIGASRPAVPPPNATLVRRNFSTHGCCPPAPLDLYVKNVGPGVVRLPSHATVGDGPSAHTYLMLLQLHARPLFRPTTPRARNLLDSFFHTNVVAEDFNSLPAYIRKGRNLPIREETTVAFSPRKFRHDISRSTLRRNVSATPHSPPADDHQRHESNEEGKTSSTNSAHSQSTSPLPRRRHVPRALFNPSK